MVHYHIDGAKMVVTYAPSSQHEFPLELLKTLVENKTSVWALKEALFFYRVSQNYEEVRWSTVEESLKENLTGWGVYFNAAFDDMWDFWAPASHFQNADDSYYELVDVAGNIFHATLKLNDQVLLVKLAADEFAELQDLSVKTKQEEDAYNAVVSKVEAGEALTPEEEKVSGLADWELKLLRQ